MIKYDIVVLGGGPGGYTAAIRGAQLGGKVALIEKADIGGTCLNTGCIPTKTLVKNAEFIQECESIKKRGIKIDNITIDLGKAIKNKNSIVRRLRAGVGSLLQSNSVDVYSGEGKVLDNNIIRISNDESTTEILYDKLIIGTGSKPAVPPISGLSDCKVLTNETILELEEIPKHLIIIGGGVIGVEFAEIFSSYGSEITIIEMMPSLIPNFDEFVQDQLKYNLESKGVNVLLSTKVNRIENSDNDTLSIYTDQSSEPINGDEVLICVGRVPVTLGLEELDLEIEKGFVKVDDECKTSHPGVYAIGDVTGKQMLAHVASHTGIIAAENAMGENSRINLNEVPSCIYTIPEIASIGITEDIAKKKGIEVIQGEFPLAASGKALASGNGEGLFKIYAKAEGHEVVGANLIGNGSTELIAEVAAFIKTKSTLEDIGSTIHAHPSIAEAVCDAAHDALGMCLNMPKK